MSLKLSQLLTMKEGVPFTNPEDGYTYKICNGVPCVYVQDNSFSGKFINKARVQLPCPKGYEEINYKEVISALKGDGLVTHYLKGILGKESPNIDDQRKAGVARKVVMKVTLKKSCSYSKEQLIEMKPQEIDFNNYVDVSIVSDTRPSSKLKPCQIVVDKIN